MIQKTKERMMRGIARHMLTVLIFIALVLIIECVPGIKIPLVQKEIMRKIFVITGFIITIDVMYTGDALPDRWISVAQSLHEIYFEKRFIDNLVSYPIGIWLGECVISFKYNLPDTSDCYPVILALQLYAILIYPIRRYLRKRFK